LTLSSIIIIIIIIIVIVIVIVIVIIIIIVSIIFALILKIISIYMAEEVKSNNRAFTTTGHLHLTFQVLISQLLELFV